MVSAPVLAYPQFSSPHPFILETDASTKGLGAVLAQQDDGKVHPIAFASRSLTCAEQNYAITELETLGIVWVVKLFRPYILGHRCVVFTDHAACTSLLGAKNTSSKLVRWAMAIQELDLDIRHRAGKSNHVADALSRNPVEVSRVLMFESVKSVESEDLVESVVSEKSAESVESGPSSIASDTDIGALQHQAPQLVQIFQYIFGGRSLAK